MGTSAVGGLSTYLGQHGLAIEALRENGRIGGSLLTLDWIKPGGAARADARDRAWSPPADRWGSPQLVIAKTIKDKAPVLAVLRHVDRIELELGELRR